MYWLHLTAHSARPRLDTNSRSRSFYFSAVPALQNVDARTVVDRQPITSLLVVIHSKMATMYAPAVPLDGDTAVGEVMAPNSLPLLTSQLLLKGTLFCLLVTLIVSYTRSSWRRLPPQPRRLPIIGNLFQLSDKKWLFSRDSKERFGE